MVAGRCARTAASFWVFLTPGTTVFFWRARVLFGSLGVFFCAAADVRLAKGFFPKGFFARVFAAADLEAFRAAGLVAVARCAFGRADLAFTLRPLTEDFGADRRDVVRDVDRLKPFVTGLLIRRSRSERRVGLSTAVRTSGSLT